MQKYRIKNIPLDNIKEKMIEIGEKPFRAQQLVKWLYQKRVGAFEQMNNMPKDLREKMDQVFGIDKMVPEIILESQCKDAVKFGFRCFESPHIIESVLLIDGKRRTACISSQLGCGLGCVFCETGKMGFIRNLSQEEIIGQLIGINDYLVSNNDQLITNIVFMGMGEALSNFDNFRTSLDIIQNAETFNIGGRRITVSTAGVVPSIERLIKEKMNIGLAISLNAFTNEQRSKLMPVNNKYPIEMLVNIAKKYYNSTGRPVTFEYVIIDGETNTKEAVNALHKYLGGFPCKLNLIPVNPSREHQMKGPSDTSLTAFADELSRRGLTATVRKSRGRDIWGACGQLAGKSIASTC